MKKIKFKNLNFLLSFYTILLLSSISCFSDKMEILFHEASTAQFDFYICDSMICPDTKSTSVGKTIILDIPDLDPKATDINWKITNAPGGAIWYPPEKNKKTQSFTPDSSGIYYINVSYFAKGTKCSCDFIVDVDISECNTNICPGSATIPLGNSTTLDIQGVDSDTTQIFWSIISSPGGATWNPPTQNAITEIFTPSEVGTYNLQVSYVVDGYTCSCDFIVNAEPQCDQNICPGSTTITVGDTTKLDIKGVDPAATQINWIVKNGPGGGIWNPAGQNQVVENFTPDSVGKYNMEVSYQLGGLTCSCDFDINVEQPPPSCDNSICPSSTTIKLGESTKLDIKGVDQGATKIKWSIVSSPGGATWNPSEKNAITEIFTPSKVGKYKLQVSYDLYGSTCTCDFNVNVEQPPSPCDDSICPESTSTWWGLAALLNINKVDPSATKITWDCVQTPSNGYAFFDAQPGNDFLYPKAVFFTVSKPGKYKCQVSYFLNKKQCICDFNVDMKNPGVCPTCWKPNCEYWPPKSDGTKSH